jgi:CHAD domain-containing protein
MTVTVGTSTTRSATTRPPQLACAVGPESTAGAVILAHLASQVQVILDQEGLVRVFDADAVHNTRVATRHLRSVLATFRQLFDRGVTEPIRAELTWLSRFLGHARDLDVQRVHLLAAVAAEPGSLVMGPVAAHIDVEMQREFRTAELELSEALDSPRYGALLNTLGSLLAHPPLTARAGRPARPTLVRLVGRSWERMRARAQAQSCPDRGERDRQLHEVRKAAKGLRYACEAVRPAFGKSAARLASVAESWQSILGEHQDSVVARNILRSMGSRMFLDGENPFTIGRLHALEQARSVRAEQDFCQSWGSGSRPKTRKWLQN